MTQRKRQKSWLRLVLGVVLLVVVVVVAHFGAAGYRDWRPDAEVARLAELLRLEAGMTVAEIGAGKGRMTVRMAKIVGPNGAVISTEIDEDRLADIREAVEEAGLNNVKIVEAGKRKTNLPAECCDAIFMVKVYHHFTDPGSLNASLFESLRPGGRLAVVDFPPAFWMFWAPHGVPEDRGGHGMPRELLIEELTEAGFEVERDIADWWTWPQRRYCVVARKPSSAK